MYYLMTNMTTNVMTSAMTVKHTVYASTALSTAKRLIRLLRFNQPPFGMYSLKFISSSP